MKLVKITWVDHSKFSNCSWRGRKEIESLTPFDVISVGWILKETKDYYIIVSTRADNDTSFENEFCILKGTVKKVKEL